jgi:hypothetical protein
MRYVSLQDFADGSVWSQHTANMREVIVIELTKSWIVARPVLRVSHLAPRLELE